MSNIVAYAGTYFDHELPLMREKQVQIQLSSGNALLIVSGINNLKLDGDTIELKVNISILSVLHNKLVKKLNKCKGSFKLKMHLHEGMALYRAIMKMDMDYTYQLELDQIADQINRQLV